MVTNATTPNPPDEKKEEQNKVAAPPPVPQVEQAQGMDAQMQVIGMTPQSFTDAWRFSKMIAQSDLAPKDFIDKPLNVMVAIQMGAEVGLNPMAALQNIAVINGRPSIWGDAALAIVMSHRDYEWHKEHQEGQGNDRVAVCEVKRKNHEPYTVRFTWAMAQLAGLTSKKGPWQEYPNRMLQMRARSWALRDKFPDALRGMGIAEEVRDVPTRVAVVVDDLPDDVQRKSLNVGSEPDPKGQSPEAAAAPVEPSNGQPRNSTTSSDAPAVDATESTEREQREQAQVLQTVLEQERIARDVKPVNPKQTELLPAEALERLKTDIEQGVPMGDAFGSGDRRRGRK